jgi:hypothetical protein
VRDLGFPDLRKSVCGKLKLVLLRFVAGFEGLPAIEKRGLPDEA